jgi:hypothetical protein
MAARNKKTKTKDLSQRPCLPMLLDSGSSSIRSFNSFLPHQLGRKLLQTKKKKNVENTYRNI